MAKKLILLSIPGLRHKDLSSMPKLCGLTDAGSFATLQPSFPCVTCPVQANMTTGKRPDGHGVVANGFFWRDKGQVEMWTSPNDCIDSPQIWDLISHHPDEPTSAVWFPLHSKMSEADYVCTPAPIHNPDGSESLWCYTRPQELYGELRDELGHFPLQHFWGPMANIKGSSWIADSAAVAAGRWQPDFFYIYLPHLDYAAQSQGPDSPAAAEAVTALDEVIGKMATEMAEAYADDDVLWLIAGEYAITPVDHVTYPNRVLRDAGLLRVVEKEDGEHLDPVGSKAWAMVDHQFSHVFVADADPTITAQVADLFRGQEGIAEVLTGQQIIRYELDHDRSGEVILISTPNSWQAYYWWQSDDRAPGYARTVDIHRKPGYDPVEMHIDMSTKSIPLDATLIKGSHGAPAGDGSQKTVLLTSDASVLPEEVVDDVDVFGMVMRYFGLEG